MHGVGDLEETGDVGAGNEGWVLALSAGDVLLCGLEAVLEDILHDVLELVVDLLGGPADALGVLGHLETGNSDTTSVGGLAGCVPESTVLLLLAGHLEHVNGLLGATHVGALGDELGAAGDQRVGLLLGHLVLGSAGKRDVDLDVGPWAGTLDEGVGVARERRQRLALDLQGGNGLNVLGCEVLALLGNERTSRVRQRQNGGTKLNGLQRSVLGDVSGSRDGDTLALERAKSSVLNHVVDVVDETVSSGLGPDERSTPASSLAGQDSLPLVAVCAVGAEQPSDLASGDTDIASGNIRVRANVLAQLAHESNTELADLIVRLSLGVEVRSALATANVNCFMTSACLFWEKIGSLRVSPSGEAGHVRVGAELTTGESVLEDLLEAEEFKDRQVDSGVEAQSTLVWAEGTVELDTVGAVDLGLELVVFPDNAELDDTLWDGDDLQGGLVFGVLLEEGGVLEGRGQLWGGKSVQFNFSGRRRKH